MVDFTKSEKKELRNLCATAYEIELGLSLEKLRREFSRWEEKRMSEYQYYEFQTIDRSLTEKQMRELRACSTRATITSNRFVNTYNWGDLKGDPRKWMEQYFDAFVYVANWGTHELMFRFPSNWIDYNLVKKISAEESVSVWKKGDFVVVQFVSQDEDGDTWDDDGGGWLASLISLREDMIRGDCRALYLAWLAGVQNGEFTEDDLEPFLPSGLNELTAPLKALIEFLRLDENLVSAAAQNSPKMESVAPVDFQDWVESLSSEEKTKWLLLLASDEASHARFDFLKLFQKRCSKQAIQQTNVRSVAGLMEQARLIAEENQREESKKAEREKVRLEQEREKYLDQLAKQKSSSWRKVETLLQAKRPSDYDIAVQLLKDLSDLAVREGRIAETEKKIQELRTKYRTRSAFHRRLNSAGL